MYSEDYKVVFWHNTNEVSTACVLFRREKTTFV